MKSTVIVFITLAIAGLLNIIYPFKGDQALFMMGAKMLAGGGVLYRDLWDLKQPGIYWFYHAAGYLFGYTDTGVHVAELLWFLALAVFISASMKARFVLPWMSDVCAVLTVGVYFSVCGTWHLTQLEGLVSLPLFCCLWLVMPPATGKRGSLVRVFIFGMLVAVVTLFKLMLIAIPVTFLLIAVLPDLKTLLRNGLVTVAGAAVVMFPVVLYFSAQHQLPLIYKTFFVYPPRIITELPMNSIKVLLHGSRWFLLAAGPLLPLAFIALVCRLRKSVDRYTLAIISWVIVATLLVLIQRMWWEYHFLLVLFPLGILATMGLEDAALWLRSRQYHLGLTTVFLAAVLCPFVLRSLYKAVEEARHRRLQNFRTHISPDYANAVVEAQWLAANAQQAGDIYLLGDPLINFLSGRKQTVTINGWSPEWFLAEQWSELAGEIDAKRPRYLFVAADNQSLIAERGTPVGHLLAAKYAPARTDDVGIWYVAK